LALDNFSKAIELNDETSSFYYNRAVTYKQLGEYRSGIQDLTRAVQLDKGESKFVYTRAILWMKLDDMQAAEADLQVAMQLAPENINVIKTYV